MSIDFFIGLIPELRDMGLDVVTVSSDGPELEKVKQAGGKVIIVQMERHISLLKDLKSLWSMVRVFRKERPDMVHSMTPKAGLICMMAGWITRVPVRVHMFTGLVFPSYKGLKRRLLMATDWLTCLCATHIIPEGEGVKADLINNGITKKPINVLGYGNCRGIDLKRFDPEIPEVKAEARKLRKEGVFTFITIGRLVGDKGINELTEAFVKLNKEFPDTRLLLVGGKEQDLDPLKPETLAIIESNECIAAVGPQKDVRPWLLASDVFVLPSHREGFPNVVIEAGAMGLPSIVTDINGSREIIIDGKNGIIIPPKDIDALYKVMKECMMDKRKIESLSENARPLIASRFEQSYVRKCLKDFYKEVMPK